MALLEHLETTATNLFAHTKITYSNSISNQKSAIGSSHTMDMNDNHKDLNQGGVHTQEITTQNSRLHHLV
jgi:hypothetical protein